jgi:hypothetical protein
LRDGWFIFDSFLVCQLVLETWVVPLLRRNGNFARRLSEGEHEGEQRLNLSFLRLLRLGRLTRMVRVLRAVPELVTMVKGMFAALRSVWSTLILLVIALYVFGLVFKMRLGDPRSPRFLPEYRRARSLVGLVPAELPEPLHRRRHLRRDHRQDGPHHGDVG